MREPAVAGAFYPAEKSKLQRAIKNCFLSKFGPGKLPTRKGMRTIFGAVVPHAGYAYSGPAAAWAYKALAEADRPELIVILGPPHTYPTTASVWQGEDWLTPLGKIEIARDIKTGGDTNPLPHLQEHCIEVQLPFLQFIYEKVPPVLPIMVSAPLAQCVELGKQLASALKGKNALILASSDFTHAGPAYGFFPSEDIGALDTAYINNILKLNTAGLVAEKKKATICGIAPIVTMLAALAESHPKCKGRLLKYYTSSDISGDKSNSVSYAAIVFE